MVLLKTKLQCFPITSVFLKLSRKMTVRIRKAVLPLLYLLDCLAVIAVRCNAIKPCPLQCVGYPDKKCLIEVGISARYNNWKIRSFPMSQLIQKHQQCMRFTLAVRSYKHGGMLPVLIYIVNIVINNSLR